MGQSVEEEIPEPVSPYEYQSGRIYCANCIQCKLIPECSGGSHYVLRIRCAAGKWRKKLGEEKTYKYSTIIRRHLASCDSYDEMGDTREFIRELKRTLPRQEEPGILMAE